jgi:IS5 family transposase
MSKPRVDCKGRELFRTPILEFADTDHPLVVLANKLDWQSLEEHFDNLYKQGPGQPPLRIRLVLGLHLIKYLDNLSDEAVVLKFIENPYYQHFCGNAYFEHKIPCDPSSLTRWRKRINPKGFEKILKETIDLAKRERLVKPSEFRRVYLDTTVQEKNIAFPTDARLYFKGIRLLNSRAQKLGISPKQSFKFTSKRLMVKYGNYKFAKQSKRAKNCLRKLKTAFGRLIRDLQRKVIESKTSNKNMDRLLSLCIRIFNQKRTDKNKIYSYHAPEVKCIAKGKAHKKYEFGNKVSIASTAKSGWIVGVESFAENIYDGKTIADALAQVYKVQGVSPKEALTDRGYKGYTGFFMETHVYHQGQRRGISKSMRSWLRKRSRIEPLISHMKGDHRMDRNFLLGDDGDRTNSILSGIAFNLRKIMRGLAGFCHVFFTLAILDEIWRTPSSCRHSSS